MIRAAKAQTGVTGNTFTVLGCCSNTYFIDMHAGEENFGMHVARVPHPWPVAAATLAAWIWETHLPATGFHRQVEFFLVKRHFILTDFFPEGELWNARDFSCRTFLTLASFGSAWQVSRHHSIHVVLQLMLRRADILWKQEQEKMRASKPLLDFLQKVMHTASRGGWPGLEGNCEGRGVAEMWAGKGAVWQGTGEAGRLGGNEAGKKGEGGKDGGGEGRMDSGSEEAWEGGRQGGWSARRDGMRVGEEGGRVGGWEGSGGEWERSGEGWGDGGDVDCRGGQRRGMEGRGPRGA